MIIKIENKNPRTTFLTSNGNRTPKEVWFDEETGVRGMTKKDVVIHCQRLHRMGITPDMTDEEAIVQAKKYITEKNKEVMKV